jgi:hypothetical protein
MTPMRPNVHFGTVKSMATSVSPLLKFFEQGKALPKWDRESKPVYGRSWKASELRGKSFEDLHKLWYIILRERNVLSTQKAEAKRQGVVWMGEHRDVKCRQSMSRIRHVLINRVQVYRKAMHELLLRSLPEEQAQIERLKHKVQELCIKRYLKHKRNFRNWRRSHVHQHPLF